jgi:hypothetical protein
MNLQHPLRVVQLPGWQRGLTPGPLYSGRQRDRLLNVFKAVVSLGRYCAKKIRAERRPARHSRHAISFNKSTLDIARNS